MTNTLAESVEQLAFQLAEKFAASEIEKLVGYLDMLVHGKKNLEVKQLSAGKDDSEPEPEPVKAKATTRGRGKASTKAAEPESSDDDEEPF